jgi:hypothetical protein
VAVFSEPKQAQIAWPLSISSQKLDHVFVVLGLAVCVGQNLEELKLDNSSLRLSCRPGAAYHKSSWPPISLVILSFCIKPRIQKPGYLSAARLIF